MIDYTKSATDRANRTAPNGVPMLLLQGLLEEPKVEGAPQNGQPIQIGNQLPPPKKPVMKSVLKK